MLGRCFSCAELLTPADGPCLVGRIDDTGAPRQPFHLRCWVNEQAAAPVQAASRSRQRGPSNAKREAAARAA